MTCAFGLVQNCLEPCFRFPRCNHTGAVESALNNSLERTVGPKYAHLVEPLKTGHAKDRGDDSDDEERYATDHARVPPELWGRRFYVC
jgi:hypothetical protein